jgi:glycosyltransferase involved in cell wall biosynthesis
MRDLPSPSISVVIAARDASVYLGATLMSLVEQSVPADQVVVYDDGSSDATAEIAERFVDRLPGLTVIRGGESVGISAARNRANAAATSDYIAVLDADDLFGPETIATYSEFLAKRPDTDLAYADTRVYDEGLSGRGKARRYPQFSFAR